MGHLPHACPLAAAYMPQARSGAGLGWAGPWEAGEDADWNVGA